MYEYIKHELICIIFHVQHPMPTTFESNQRLAPGPMLVHISRSESKAADIPVQGISCSYIIITIDNCDTRLYYNTNTDYPTAHQSYLKKAKDCIQFLYYERCDCDHNGLNYVIEGHDITLTIPEGAVAEGEKVHFEVGVAMYGPFHRQANIQPVSPILWFHIVEGVKLNKQCALILPHCCTQIDQLYFAIVDHRSVIKDDAGQPQYVFQVYSRGAAKFYSDPMRGTIQIDCYHHIFCIVKRAKRGHWCHDVSFLLARVDLRPLQTVHEFHLYCVFNLATHRKV